MSYHQIKHPHQQQHRHHHNPDHHHQQDEHHQDDWELIHSELERKTPDWVSAGMWRSLASVREQQPKLQCITNFVSTDLVASGLLALRCDPIFLHEILPSHTTTPSCVYLNIGTVSSSVLLSMVSVARHAKRLGTPVVVDVVSCMFTELRTFATTTLLSLQPNVVVCNVQELNVLFSCCPRRQQEQQQQHQQRHKSHQTIQTPAPISTHHHHHHHTPQNHHQRHKPQPQQQRHKSTTISQTIRLAKRLKCTIAIVDPDHGWFVSDGKCTLHVRNTHRLVCGLSTIGCGRTLVSSIMAAFVGVACRQNIEAGAQPRGRDFVLACAHAVSFVACCYENACGREGRRLWAGSLREILVDEMWGLDKGREKGNFGRIVDLHWVLGEEEDDGDDVEGDFEWLHI